MIGIFKNKVVRIILSVIITAGVIFLSIHLYAYNLMRQARFNVDILYEYIKSYEAVADIQIESLAGLPEFHYISTYDSLEIKSDDFKDGVVSKYIYDMEYLDDGKYVISASPIGSFPPLAEFAITEKGDLTVNRVNVDIFADRYDEVGKWKSIPRIERVRLAEVPEYVKE